MIKDREYNKYLEKAPTNSAIELGRCFNKAKDNVLVGESKSNIANMSLFAICCRFHDKF